jgi:hypothetical protein
MCHGDSTMLRKSSSHLCNFFTCESFSCFFYDLSTELFSRFFTMFKLKEFHNQVQYRYSNVQEVCGDNVQFTIITTKAYHCHVS